MIFASPPHERYFLLLRADTHLTGTAEAPAFPPPKSFFVTAHEHSRRRGVGCGLAVVAVAREEATSKTVLCKSTF